jgi:hypothetical protein
LVTLIPVDSVSLYRLTEADVSPHNNEPCTFARLHDPLTFHFLRTIHKLHPDIGSVNLGKSIPTYVRSNAVFSPIQETAGAK